MYHPNSIKKIKIDINYQELLDWSASKIVQYNRLVLKENNAEKKRGIFNVILVLKEFRRRILQISVGLNPWVNNE